MAESLKIKDLPPRDTAWCGVRDCRAPVQLRLAIEKRKGYKGAVKSKGVAKKGKAKPKTKSITKSVRPKSVKARYVKTH